MSKRTILLTHTDKQLDEIEDDTRRYLHDARGEMEQIEQLIDYLTNLIHSVKWERARRAGHVNQG